MYSIISPMVIISIYLRIYYVRLAIDMSNSYLNSDNSVSWHRLIITGYSVLNSDITLRAGTDQLLQATLAVANWFPMLFSNCCFRNTRLQCRSCYLLDVAETTTIKCGAFDVRHYFVLTSFHKKHPFCRLSLPV